MVSQYSEEGVFLGQRVENLTDGPTEELRGEPYGTMGKVSPAQGVCEFQNHIWNSRPYFGLRTVWHREHGTVEQALVESIGGLAWMNFRFSQRGY